MTQVTDVKPQMTVATYLDDATGYEVYQEVIGTSLPPALPAQVCMLSEHWPGWLCWPWGLVLCTRR